MSDPVRLIAKTDGFDPSTKPFIDRYILYRRALGTINEGLGGAYIHMGNVNHIDIPLNVPLQSLGFYNRELVDIHTMFGFSGLHDPPPAHRVTHSILRPNSPPGCVQVCFSHPGKAEIVNGERRLTMEDNGQGLQNGGVITIPAHDSRYVEWVQPGVPFTAYEVYLICRRDTFPVIQGRLLMLQLARLLAGEAG